MKTLPLFQSLTQQFKKWRQKCQPLRTFVLSRQFASGAGSQKRQTLANTPPPLRWLMLRFTCGYRKNSSSVVFVLAVVSLTGVLGHGFYNQPQLNVGTVAPETIKAPFAASVEDTKTTEANRKAAWNFSVPVLMYDLVTNQQINQELQQAVAEANELRLFAGTFPFTETSVLSISAQRYLRNCLESEWQAIINAVVNTGKAQNLALPGAVVNNAALAPAVAELEAYRLTTSPQNFSTLIATISQIRQQYAQALAKLSEPGAKSQPLYQASLLELSDEDWGKTQTGIFESAERIITQGISPGLPPRILQEAVSLQVRLLVPTTAEPLAIELLLNVLKPNLKQNVEQTRIQAEKAAAAVAPVIISVRQGEVIAQAGEAINQQDFVLLDYFNLSRRAINWLGLGRLSGIVIFAVTVFGLVERRLNAKLRQSDRLLVLLLSLSTLLLAKVGVPYTSLPAIGLLLGSFYGSFLGVTVVGLLTVVLPISLEIAWEQLLAGAAGGMLATLVAGRMRSREELALLGGAVGLTQGLVYLVVNFVLSATPALWYVVVGKAAIFGLSGLAWSIVALGLSPYLEHLFDLVTPIRLAELANPNRPLLKRLATVAPGTFQHTLFVATLAEAAAKALSCNVELVRAGTLYHDIGKMHDPLAFIENQMGGPNKHDQMNEPWTSAEIIKKHVSAGLVIARKHRLPRTIQAFIPEHQGTMLIAYFYYQATQIAAVDSSLSVQESDFRYDGPIPQSRETAIVMLADSCEAALRSLKDASTEEALAMVNKILRSRWQDNQMVDSGITRQEMSQIAEIFVQVWLQFHHKRIAYPKLGARGE